MNTGCLANGAGPRLLVSAATRMETAIVLESRRGQWAGRELDLFLSRAKVETVPVDEDQAEMARAAFRRFGRAGTSRKRRSRQPLQAKANLAFLGPLAT